MSNETNCPENRSDPFSPSTWVFLLGPLVGLGAVLVALAIVPLGGVPGLLAFPGDLVLMAVTVNESPSASTAMAAQWAKGSSRSAQHVLMAAPSVFCGIPHCWPFLPSSCKRSYLPL